MGFKGAGFCLQDKDIKHTVEQSNVSQIQSITRDQTQRRDFLLLAAIFFLWCPARFARRKKVEGKESEWSKWTAGTGWEWILLGSGRICVHTAETAATSTHFRKSRDLKVNGKPASLGRCTWVAGTCLEGFAAREYMRYLYRASERGPRWCLLVRAFAGDKRR